MMIKDDPVISRIREIRHQISEQCEHDPEKLVAYYMKRQDKHQRKFLTLNEEEKLMEA